MRLQIDKLGKVAVTVEQDYWNIEKDYDRLTIVQKEGIFGTFITRKPTPAGTQLTNREYWIPFSSLKEDIVIDYNTFISKYGEELGSIKNHITEIDNKLKELEKTKETADKALVQANKAICNACCAVNAANSTIKKANQLIDDTSSLKEEVNKNKQDIEELNKTQLKGIHIHNNRQHVIPDVNDNNEIVFDGNSGVKIDSKGDHTVYITIDENYTATRKYVDDKVEKIDRTLYKLVNELPTENIDSTKIYLVPSKDTKEQDVYEEYLWTGKEWEFLGKKVEIDLSNYIKELFLKNSGESITTTNGVIGISSNNDIIFSKGGDSILDVTLGNKVLKSDSQTITDINNNIDNVKKEGISKLSAGLFTRGNGSSEAMTLSPGQYGAGIEFENKYFTLTKNINGQHNKAEFSLNTDVVATRDYVTTALGNTVKMFECRIPDSGGQLSEVLPYEGKIAVNGMDGIVVMGSGNSIIVTIEAGYIASTLNHYYNIPTKDDLSEYLKNNDGHYYFKGGSDGTQLDMANTQSITLWGYAGYKVFKWQYEGGGSTLTFASDCIINAGTINSPTITQINNDIEEIKSDFNSLLNDENLNDSFDTLKEVDTWIKEHESEASEIISRQNAIEDWKTNLSSILLMEPAYSLTQTADTLKIPLAPWSFQYKSNGRYGGFTTGPVAHINLPSATTEGAGVMSATDKTNLDELTNKAARIEDRKISKQIDKIEWYSGGTIADYYIKLSNQNNHFYIQSSNVNPKTLFAIDNDGNVTITGNVTAPNITAIENKLEGVTKAAEDSEVIKSLSFQDGGITHTIIPNPNNNCTISRGLGLRFVDVHLNQVQIGIDDEVIATREYVDDKINFLINSEGELEDSFDTLKEVDIWIKSHEGETADIISDINELKSGKANKSEIEGIRQNYATKEALNTVNNNLNNAIGQAVGTLAQTLTEQIKALEARITQLESDLANTKIEVSNE